MGGTNHVLLNNIPNGWDQSFQRGTKYFMAFTEIFGLGGPNILKYLVRGDKICGGQNVL